MCMTCGCGNTDSEHGTHGHHDGGADHGHGHGHFSGDHSGHPHAGPDSHTGGPDSQAVRRIRVEQDVLHKNALLAERCRGWFEARNILALNLVGSPGAGKTALLERTLTDLGREMHFAVIEGDQHTDNDARRIQATGVPVTQINTEQVCHLDAEMIQHAIGHLNPREGSTLMIENVGNLVCPALFDLGESGKVVITSLPEGEDKPVKYPYMFQEAHLILLNKIDLFPHLSFDLEQFMECAKEINPRVEIITTSATSGEGLEHWYDWLRERRASHCASA